VIVKPLAMLARATTHVKLHKMHVKAKVLVQLLPMLAKAKTLVKVKVTWL